MVKAKVKVKGKAAAVKLPVRSKAGKTWHGIPAIGGMNAYFLPDGVRKFVRGKAGKSTGLGLEAFRCKLFYDNERVPKSQRMTDDAMCAAIKAEFPGIKSTAIDPYWFNTYRSYYNLGQLTGGVIPEVRARRFDENGNEVVHLPRAFWKLPPGKRVWSMGAAMKTARATAATVAKSKGAAKLSAAKLRDNAAKLRKAAAAKTADPVAKRKAARLPVKAAAKPAKGSSQGKNPRKSVKPKPVAKPQPVKAAARKSSKPAAVKRAKPARKPAGKRPANPTPNPSRMDPPSAKPDATLPGTATGEPENFPAGVDAAPAAE